MALQECQKFHSQPEAKRNIRGAVHKVAARLGSTPSICRKCYIHPEITRPTSRARYSSRSRKHLSPEEAAVLTLLRTRLNVTLKRKLEGSLEAA
jgi:DNA topoisomerase-1